MLFLLHYSSMSFCNVFLFLTSPSPCPSLHAFSSFLPLCFIIHFFVLPFHVLYKAKLHECAEKLHVFCQKSGVRDVISTTYLSFILNTCPFWKYCQRKKKAACHVLENSSNCSQKPYVFMHPDCEVRKRLT